MMWRIIKNKMDFETRQKSAGEEINAALIKYNVGLQPFLNFQVTGILPSVKLVDMEKKEEVSEEKDVESKKTKKGKK